MQYMTHLIGSVRWMTQGLCFAVSGSTYYGDNEMHCSDGYGRLYTYAAAAGACPAGWRLPSRAEVEDALDNGLEAIYTGRGSGSDDNFIDQMGFMWTSAAPASGDNDNCSTADCGVILIQNNPDYKIEPPFFQIDSYSKRFGVRCVQ